MPYGDLGIPSFKKPPYGFCIETTVSEVSRLPRQPRRSAHCCAACDAPADVHVPLKPSAWKWPQTANGFHISKISNDFWVTSDDSWKSWLIIQVIISPIMEDKSMIIGVHWMCFKRTKPTTFHGKNRWPWSKTFDSTCLEPSGCRLLRLGNRLPRSCWALQSLIGVAIFHRARRWRDLLVHVENRRVEGLSPVKEPKGQNSRNKCHLNYQQQFDDFLQLNSDRIWSFVLKYLKKTPYCVNTRFPCLWMAWSVAFPTVFRTDSSIPALSLPPSSLSLGDAGSPTKMGWLSGNQTGQGRVPLCI